MINKPFDEIGADDLNELVANSTPEDRTLEYKESLPAGSDTDKREFLADVTSFANAAGGDLIFGVRDRRSQDNRPSGVADALVGIGEGNSDAEIRRLDSLCRDGIAPRIIGLRMKAITAQEDVCIVIVRVPKSWSAPHMIAATSRFFSRNSAGKYPLDVSELRSAFALSESLSDRIRRFREERLARIAADETPVPLSERARMILHIVPVGAFESGASVDVSRLAPVDMPPIYSDTGWSGRLNFDGFLTHAQLADKTYHTYTQLFRNGAVEAVEAFLLRPREGRTIASVAYERLLIQSLDKYRQLLRGLQIDAPWFVMLTLMGIKGYAMGLSPMLMAEHYPFDRDVLVLPEVVIEDGNATSGRVLRPAFDALWQSAGLSGSYNYAPDGEWAAHR